MRPLSVSLLVLLSIAYFAPPLCAQQAAPVSPPGDSLTTPGPLAKNLSPNLDRRNLARDMALVADWQLNRMPPQPQFDWTWAALYDGFLAVPPEVAGKKYQNAVLAIAQKLQWQPGPRVMHADDQAIGQTYLTLYATNKDPRIIAPMRDRLDAEIATPDPADATHPVWWWCDALFMAPPVFAQMSAATGDAKYLAYLDRQWQITTHLLYNADKHLYARDAGYLNKHEENGEPIFWSRGNGWVMGGIVRVLQQLPPNSPLRPRYVALLKQMAAEALVIQGHDGLWRPGLLNADAYPLPEVSGSAFITYALAYGVNEKILDRATYWPAVQKAWAGMLTHVYADGRLGCIQPVGAAPDAFTASSSYVYGVGAYLLAGSEIYRGVK